VQIRVHVAGMCHSDYHLTTGATPIALPALGGHEGAGVITKVGKNFSGLAEGDHVILAFIPACGECQPCLKGFRSLCDRGALLLGGKAIADSTSRVHAGSTEVAPMNLLGTFAPYMTVHKDSMVKIDPDIPFESAAILGCALPTGFGSATNVAEVQPGETVVIVGVGGIGMSALQGAVISGAKNVIVIDPVDFKRDQAVKFGATHVYPSIFGGGSSHVDTPKLVGLYKSGLLKIDEMVTNTYSLDDINGYQDMLDGKNIRGVIKFTESDW
jgi:S-(hydroxymethyl)glutathione dehydrogenase / alcohol dehydrogenase